MSETPVCGVCGRTPVVFWAGRGWQPEGGCWREAHDDDDATCYRLGWQRARAALSAAEKERDEARDAANKNAAEGYRAWRENARLREAGEEALRMLREVDTSLGQIEEADVPHLYAVLRASGREASAASEAQPPPTSPVASSTQEGEK